MTTNHFFKNNNSFPQQELLNSLTREVIQMSGVDVLYLPRTTLEKDDILNEEPLSEFKSAVDIEMYVNSTESFGGAGDVATKFGLDVEDELIMIVNKERFFTETAMNTPREGDLIYFPLDKNLFEIKFVEDEKPFYTLGKNTVFEMTCEKFVFSEETFNVPLDSSGALFDKFERENSVTIKMRVDGGLLKYKIDEEVYQIDVATGVKTAKGLVARYNSDTNILHLYRTTGTFVIGSDIIGETTGTTRSLIEMDDQEIVTTPYSDNDSYETEGDGVLDFSELDPWSEGDL